MKNIYYLALGLALAFVSTGALFYLNQQPAEAVTARDWNASNIIDDAEFADKKSMSVAQIQSWLDTRLANCDPNGTKISELGGVDYNGDGKITRAEYGRYVGNPAPFTCLNKYHEVPKTTPSTGIPVSNYGKSTIPSGAKSAAQLIYDAAQAYSINPKVLLVKLGTESAGPLTSDVWPLKSQYTYAMGAHCPDSGPGGSANCSTLYAGFSIQMREAAKLLRDYLTGMDQPWWGCIENGKKVQCSWNRSNGSDPGGGYKVPGANNFILWNVRPSGCGGSTILLSNKATAALYTYTPYQPNNAALNNMYGTGDRCSAYGNRNFWRVYNDWFGMTSTTPFFRLNGSSRVYIEGANNSYYYVPGPSILEGYGYGKYFNHVKNVPSSYVSGKTLAGDLSLLARFEGDPVYAVGDGELFHFDSRSMLDKYGLSLGQESKLPAYIAESLPNSGTMKDILSQTNGSEVYLIEAGTKRHISGGRAYANLGNPTYISRPYSRLTKQFANLIKDGPPILYDGTYVKSRDTNQYWIWNNSQAMLVDGDISTSWNLTPGYTTSKALIEMLPKGSPITAAGASSANGVRFILNNGKRYPIENLKEYLVEAPSINFATLPDSIINQFTLSSNPELLRNSNQDPVYLLKDGQLQHVYSRDEASFFNLDLTRAVSLHPENFKLFKSSDKVLLADNRLVRDGSKDQVYLINNGDKHLIRSRVQLENFGLRISETISLRNTSFSGFRSGDPLSYSLSYRDGSNWLISNGKRYKVPSHLQHHFKPQTGNVTASEALINSLTKSSTLTQLLSDSKGRVYLIDNGHKRWITSPSLFATKYRWGDVTRVNDDVLNQWPTGSNISS